MRKNAILAIAIIIPIALASGIIGAVSEESIEVSTDSETYHGGDAVLIFIENVGNETLHGMPSCAVYDESGELVQGFAFIAIVWELGPGETITVIWNQRDLNGNQVSPGVYYIEAGFAEYMETTKVEIVNLGAIVYTDGDIVKITISNIGLETVSFGSGFVVYDESGNKVADATYRHMDTLPPGESMAYHWGIGPEAKGYEGKEFEGDYQGLYYISTNASESPSVVQSPIMVFVD